MKLVGMFALVLVLVASAASPAPVHAQATAGSLYTCAMHPDVAESKAGACPVCSMPLKARPMTAAEQSVADFFNAYDAAFVAKDMDKLATMYTADTTVFEGGGGLATYQLVKQGGVWKIKHTHTSAKRRAPAGVA